MIHIQVDFPQGSPFQEIFDRYRNFIGATSDNQVFLEMCAFANFSIGSLKTVSPKSDLYLSPRHFRESVSIVLFLDEEANREAITAWRNTYGLCRLAHPKYSKGRLAGMTLRLIISNAANYLFFATPTEELAQTIRELNLKE